MTRRSSADASPGIVASTVDVVRRRLRLTGVVQGVGFRPFVQRLATELGLAGFVGNDRDGVFVEVEGAAPSVESFEARVRSDAPSLAVVETMTVSPQAVHGETDFRIAESVASCGAPATLVPADVATCAQCVSEIGDPGDRRYRYPFTNCTNCGPRFTIIRELPYDRARTTMDGFVLCAACLVEYGDPADRRFHAEPVACPDCGPQLAFERHGEEVIRGTDAVVAAVHESIAAGEVVAVKGIGGYHLACDASDRRAVALLRERKGRVDKPFALMVANLVVARELVELSAQDEDVLASPAGPIVLCPRRSDAPLADNVAPGSPYLGLMLPYSPLHHLLFRAVPDRTTHVPRVLVLTSGNLSDEPICTENGEARVRLAALADAYVTHDRPIHVSCDDSVVRTGSRRRQRALEPLRRSRGYAPLPVTLPFELAVPTLAVGGHLKNTFCVAAGRRAWMSQHVGDMDSLEALRAFECGVERLCALHGVDAVRLAVDMHPGYVTSRWARENARGREVVPVQHHHAHVAALMAEHGLGEAAQVIGMAFDGTGYGVDAEGHVSIWGGEVLVAGYAGFERVGHLRELPLPGADAAVRNPCRVALAYLAACGLDGGEGDLAPHRACSDEERRVVDRMVERGSGCATTSSMGRLFDAVASLLGVRQRVTYEAQAAIELEALAATHDSGGVWPVEFAVDADGVIDPAPLLGALVAGVRAGVPAAALAHGFHGAVAALVVDRAATARAESSLDVVALTGGTFQNVLLTTLAREGLEAAGFEVLTHEVVPPNDGGLALGQAVIAGTRTV